MDASKFKNYILGIIFYRYLSERTESYMNDLLRNDGMTYESAYADERFRPTVEKWSLNRLGYIIKPKYLYKTLNLQSVPSVSVSQDSDNPLYF